MVTWITVRRQRVVGMCPEQDNDTNVEFRNADEFFKRPIDHQIPKQDFIYGISCLVRTLDPDVSCLLHCKENKKM